MSSVDFSQELRHGECQSIVRQMEPSDYESVQKLLKKDITVKEFNEFCQQDQQTVYFVSRNMESEEVSCIMMGFYQTKISRRGATCLHITNFKYDLSLEENYLNQTYLTMLNLMIEFSRDFKKVLSLYQITLSPPSFCKDKYQELVDMGFKNTDRHMELDIQYN